jgi:hypothetical protein
MKNFSSASGKVLVALGSIIGSGGSNKIELIDLSSNSSNCPTLANFPISANYIFGGMISEEKVLICAYQNCYTSGDGLFWNLTQNLKTERYAVGITTAPFPYPTNTIIVTGGYAANSEQTYNLVLRLIVILHVLRKKSKSFFSWLY